ncbi:MAG TPA: M56 family metallopeptidase [Steroidobacteraceae bacterium]|jgi:beta-lactamase regulating signal transducer with metallopeptidase domain|nr:M56 family metallopeptidase [Steroidobacteraceae bacterium]
MVTAVIEAALRGSALLAMMWLVLKAVRVRDLAAQKNAWTLVAAASLVMPFLSRAAVSVAPPLAVFRSRPEPLPVTQTCLIIYLLGLVALSLRFIIGLWMGARLRRRAVRLSSLSTDRLDVRVSPALRGPASFASTILLPSAYASWDKPMLAAVLAHEQAHVRNHDCYRLWLAALYRAAFWFNPFAHLLYRHLHMLSELTSDAAATAALGDRAGYAEILRRVASQQPLLAATVAMATPSTLSRRIKMLAQNSNPGARLGGRQTAVLMCAILILIAVAAVPMGRATALAAEQVANLEFYLVDAHANAELAQQTGKVPTGDRLYQANGRPILLKRKPVVSSAELKQVDTKETEDGTVVQVRFNARASASLLRATRENIGNQMAVVYSEHSRPGRVISAATIRGAFGTQFQITGLSPKEAQTLASQFGHALTR